MIIIGKEKQYSTYVLSKEFS